MSTRPAPTPTARTSPWLTITKAHEYTGISERHIQRLIADGHLPAYRRGRIVRLHADDLDAYLRDGKDSAA